MGVSEVNCDPAFLGWVIQFEEKSFVYPARVFLRDAVATFIKMARASGVQTSVRLARPSDFN